jgi:hypothetical protein
MRCDGCGHHHHPKSPCDRESARPAGPPCIIDPPHQRIRTDDHHARAPSHWTWTCRSHRSPLTRTRAIMCARSLQQQDSNPPGHDQCVMRSVPAAGHTCTQGRPGPAHELLRGAGRHGVQWRPSEPRYGSQQARQQCPPLDRTGRLAGSPCLWLPSTCGAVGAASIVNARAARGWVQGTYTYVRARWA